MAVTYKDINDYTKKSSVAGGEKLPVSDTEYISPSQINEKLLQEEGPKFGVFVDSTYSVGSGSSTKTFVVSIESGSEIKASLFDPDSHVGGSIKFYVKYDGENDYRSGVDVTNSTPYTMAAEKKITSVMFYKYSPSSAGEIRVRVELTKSEQSLILGILATATPEAINQIENGKYIDNNGNLQTSSAYGIYLVSLPAYTALYCSAKAVSTVCVFAYYNTGTYTPITISTDSNKVGYYYMNATGNSVSIAVCSVKANYTYQCFLSGLSIDVYRIVGEIETQLSQI